MNHIGLFEGIGGFSLAARWMGWETIAWCEWNEFGQKVLKHHFPKAQPHGDITKTDFTIYRGQCDILTGGFPCQPYSLAGKRKGKEDDRHLWPEMLRAITEIQPTWVVGENVFGLVNWSGGLVFNEVQTDLEAQGYEVFPYVLPAAAVNAPHRRDRIWFVAKNTFSNGCLLGKIEQERTKVRKFGNTCTRSSDRVHISKGNASHPNRNPTGRPGQGTSIEGIGSNHNVQQSEWGSKTELNIRPSSVPQNVMHANGTSKQGEYIRQKGEGKSNRPNSRNGVDYWQNFPTQSPVCSGDDGLSSRLDSITFPKWRNESIKAAGNAIVPQVAYQIFKTIKLYNEKL